jgi:hypothetical protein
LDPWGEKDPEVDPAWIAAPYVEEPTEEEYYEALESGLAVEPEQQRALRVLAWWRRNDAYRDVSHMHPGTTVTLTAACRRNLEALVDLLDAENESDAIMKAELLRELGEFESASHMLDHVTSANYTAIVRQIRSLCETNDMCVRELQLGA